MNESEAKVVDDRVYTLIPGETVQADIVTYKRTVMQYLMKPIAKSLSDSLRER